MTEQLERVPIKAHQLTPPLNVTRVLECSKCKEIKGEESFYKDNTAVRGRTYRCKVCVDLLTRENRLSNPKVISYIKQAASDWYRKNSSMLKEKRQTQRVKDPRGSLYRSCRGRARSRGIEFSLSPSDIVIPDFCPALGIPLYVSDGGYTDNSPSVDRLSPSVGYIKDNIRVISNRANRIKNDATLAEIEAIGRYMREQCKH